jgi:hypothetical protein
MSEASGVDQERSTTVPPHWWLARLEMTESVRLGEHDAVRLSSAERAVEGINMADALNVAVSLLRDQIRPCRSILLRIDGPVDSSWLDPQAKKS